MLEWEDEINILEIIDHGFPERHLDRSNDFDTLDRYGFLDAFGWQMLCAYVCDEI